MKKPKDIDPVDKNDKFHGYQEWYKYSYKYSYNQISVRSNYKHGLPIGYKETHRYQRTLFYIR